MEIPLCYSNYCYKDLILRLIEKSVVAFNLIHLNEKNMYYFIECDFFNFLSKQVDVIRKFI